MCLALPARVVGVADQRATVELADGRQVAASLALLPDIVAGQHVLLDRGLVVQVISEQEAGEVLALYREIERATFGREDDDAATGR